MAQLQIVQADAQTKICKKSAIFANPKNNVKIMEIPKPLIDQIKEGNVVLFLGSGASAGAEHPKMTSPPLGNHLSNLIVEKFLTDDYKDQSLQFLQQKQ